MSPPPKLSRRAVTIGGIAAGGAAVVAGAVYEVPKLFKHRLHGEYAELVGKLNDPEKAAVVGRAIQDRSAPSKEELSELKTALATTSLADVAIADAKHEKLTEADGWVLPATLATLCTLAAQSV
jgi:hypothetical protein